MSVALAVATVVLSPLTGCGPARFLSQVNGRAATAVAAAKTANAAEFAPYEYTSAVEYLHKAREEGAHAEYQIAIEYGRRAEELAARARATAEEKRGRSRGGDPAPSSDVDPSRAVPFAEPPAAAKDSP